MADEQQMIKAYEPAEVEAKWKSGNAELRNMGIRLVPMPESGD